MNGQVFPFPFVDSVIFPSDIEKLSYFNYPTTTTTESSTTTTTTTTEIMDLIYPFRPSGEFLEQLNHNNKTLRCYPTHEVLKPLIGIENWCLQLCVVHCPPALCACVHI